MSETILDIRGLVTAFNTRNGAVRAVDGISFSLPRGSITASSGPLSELLALRKTMGSAGSGMPASAAWSA